MKKQKPMTNEEYVEAGGCKCPKCGSSDISGDSIEVDSGGAYQEVGCSECGHSWRDVYTLVGYENA